MLLLHERTFGITYLVGHMHLKKQAVLTLHLFITITSEMKK